MRVVCQSRLDFWRHLNRIRAIANMLHTCGCRCLGAKHIHWSVLCIESSTLLFPTDEQQQQQQQSYDGYYGQVQTDPVFGHEVAPQESSYGDYYDRSSEEEDVSAALDGEEPSLAGFMKYISDGVSSGLRRVRDFVEPVLG